MAAICHSLTRDSHFLLDYVIFKVKGRSSKSRAVIFNSELIPPPIANGEGRGPYLEEFQYLSVKKSHLVLLKYTKTHKETEYFHLKFWSLGLIRVNQMTKEE